MRYALLVLVLAMGCGAPEPHCPDDTGVAWCDKSVNWLAVCPENVWPICRVGAEPEVRCAGMDDAGEWVDLGPAYCDPADIPAD